MQGGHEPEVRVTRTVPSAQHELATRWASATDDHCEHGDEHEFHMQLGDMPSLQQADTTACSVGPAQGAWSLMSSSTAPRTQADSTPNVSPNNDADAQLTSPPSFAEMLRVGKPKPKPAPAASQRQAEGEAAAGRRPCATAGDKEGDGSERPPLADGGEPQLAPAPSLAHAFGTALHSALATCSYTDAECGVTATECTGNKGNKKGKGKKSKQVLLFSTGATAQPFQ